MKYPLTYPAKIDVVQKNLLLHRLSKHQQMMIWKITTVAGKLYNEVRRLQF